MGLVPVVVMMTEPSTVGVPLAVAPDFPVSTVSFRKSATVFVVVASISLPIVTLPKWTALVVTPKRARIAAITPANFCLTDKFCILFSFLLGLHYFLGLRRGNDSLSIVLIAQPRASVWF